MFCFFVQAEDGIRDWSVTGVQTCALPISYAGAADGNPPLERPRRRAARVRHRDRLRHPRRTLGAGRARTEARSARAEIGRASCRERVWVAGVAVYVSQKRRVSN